MRANRRGIAALRPVAFALLIAATAPAMMSQSQAANAGLGVNLIENGNFEAQFANEGWDFPNQIVVGWEDGAIYGDTTAGFIDTVGRLIDYVENSDSEFVSNTAFTQLFNAPGGATSGPEASLGDNYLYSGEAGPGIAGSQTIDLTGDATLMATIAAGDALYTVSGWFGGWDTQTDRTDLTVNFLDSMQTSNGSTTIGNVAPADRGDSRDAWVYREAVGILPVDTEVIEFILATAATGGGHSGVIDNLSFTISVATGGTAWAEDASGDWNEASNWSPMSIPNSVDEEVIFGDAISTDRVVFTETDVTAGTIRFDNDNRYVIAGAGKVRIDSTGQGAIQVVRGSHEFQAEVEIASNTEIDIATGGVLDIENKLTLANAVTLTKTGDGTLNLNNRDNSGLAGSSLVVNGGVLGGAGQVGGDLTNNPGGTVAPANSTGVLFVEGNYVQLAGSTLEIEIAGLLAGDEHDVLAVFGNASLAGDLEIALIDDFVPAEGDTFDVLTAASISGSLNLTGDAAGFSLAVGSGVVRLAFGQPLAADFDKDGIVDGNDFLVWQANFGTTSGATSNTGDANGDAAVDGVDFLLWQAEFGSGGGEGGAASVPEPGSCVLVLLLVGLWHAALREPWSWPQGGR